MERRQTRDEDGNGVAELVIRLDAKGEKEREEVDQDQDGQAPRSCASSRTASASARRRTRTATASPRSSPTFDGDTPLRRDADTDGDGKPDTIVTFEKGEKVRQEEDRNGDGKVDARYTFDATGELLLEELDEDHDGASRCAASSSGGKVVRRTITGAKGEARVEHFENGALARAESDENGDGKHRPLELLRRRREAGAPGAGPRTSTARSTPG